MWIIIDDGSTDRTFEIIEEAAKKYEWIKGLKLEISSKGRSRGIHLSQVMKKGFDYAIKYCMEDGIKIDYVSNVDGDIILEPTFFEKAFEEMEKDSTLGIASGITRYFIDDEILDATRHENEPQGGHMIIRMECYKECKGIPISYAVDSVLKAKARLRGWKTKKVNAIAIEVRYVDTAEGFWKGFTEKGEAAYYLNLNPFHVMVKAVLYLFKRPYYIGIAYFVSYLGCLVRKKEKVKDEEVRQYFRNKWKVKLNQRLRFYLNRLNQNTKS